MLYYEVTLQDTLFRCHPFLGLLQIGIRAKIMAAPTIHVSAEENLRDPIDIKVDIIHPEPVAVVVFPAAAVDLVMLDWGELTLSSLDVLQGFSLFLHMGFTLILATLDGLDVGLLRDVIGEDDYDDDG
ncbi:hypothetical protein Tco_1228434 [Tanacetum coccineum]